MGRRKKEMVEKQIKSVDETIENIVEPVVIEDAKEVEYGVFVAEKKYINCRRGVVGPGFQVFAQDFPGGDMTIEEHIKNGGLVRREM